MDYKWLDPYKIIREFGKGLYSVENKMVIGRVPGVHLMQYYTPD